MKGTSSFQSPCSHDDDDDDAAAAADGKEGLGFVVDMVGREGVSVAAAVAMAMEMLVLMVAMSI